MNDLDICKRITEIEGFELIELITTDYAVWDETKAEYREYNPLTDDALCFKLMVKYNVEINRQCDAVYVVDRKDDDSIVFIREKTLNEAICLAIIEAHKS